MPHSGPAERDDFDLYDALNLQRDASAEDVRSAFRELARIYHPDKLASGTTGGGEMAFMRIHRAYRVLGDDVLRPFYDRYGLSGIRLAESLSDDEGGGPDASQLSLPEDRLRHLEGRVRQLLRRNEELQVQRLLGLHGSLTLAAVAAPGPHGAHLRRRWRLQYSAATHSVQIVPCELFKLTLGCATHIQGANGAGAAKLLLAASSRLSSSTTVRAGVNITGVTPEADISIVRSLTPHLTVQQRAAVSGDGCTLSLMVHPLLSRTMRCSLGCSLGEDPGVTLGFAGKSSSSGHGAKGQLSLQPGAREISAQLKCKPCKDFSLKLGPSLSPQGWALQATCTKAFHEGLTKLHWALRVRRRGLSLRLLVSRGGLRFNFPLELWPEASGPLPASELCLALALWAAPPLGIRALHSCWLAGRDLLRSWRGDLPAKEARRAAEAEALAAAEATAAEEAAALEEQRRLVAGEAARRRAEEVAVRGLEILSARYGDPALVAAPGPPGPGVLDVTDCVMAKVRGSQLCISAAPKASLLGFGAPRPGAPAAAGPPALHVRYLFGATEHSRLFGETEAVLLP